MIASRLSIIWTTSLFCVPFIFVGCSSGDVSDLDEYVAEVLAQPGGRIKPIPEVRPYDAYIYEGGARQARDPFKLFYIKQEEQALIEDQDIGLTKEMEDEIKHRNKEELEEFELDSMSMVGTVHWSDVLGEEASPWGIIRDPNGDVHRIKVGDYVGRNTGKVLNIFENKIEIREIVKNGQGRWEERQAAIILIEE